MTWRDHSNVPVMLCGQRFLPSPAAQSPQCGCNIHSPLVMDTGCADFRQVQIKLLWMYAFSWVNARSGMAGPHGRCVFNCVRQCSLVSQSSPVRYLPIMGDGSASRSTSLPTPQTLLLSILAIWWACKCHLIGVLVCMFIMNIDIFSCAYLPWVKSLLFIPPP